LGRPGPGPCRWRCRGGPRSSAGGSPSGSTSPAPRSGRSRTSSRRRCRWPSCPGPCSRRSPDRPGRRRRTGAARRRAAGGSRPSCGPRRETGLAPSAGTPARAWPQHSERHRSCQARWFAPTVPVLVRLAPRMKRIAVLTSGGDAPGMNAAIRAVVRAGVHQGWEVFGIRRGFSGLIAGNLINLEARDVGGILQQAGTMLGSARCPEFRTEDGRVEALRQLGAHDIDALVVIGGNGSQTGAEQLARAGFPVVGVASTIDNDLCGSEITIGVDTALNIALEAIDRLKVTASSHQRAFLVEVMGRDCGYLALAAAVAGGAEAAVIPEMEMDPENLATELREAYQRGKPHALV